MRQIGTNEPTRHELIAENIETGRQFLICYSSRKSTREGMLCLTAVVPPLTEARIYTLAKATDTDPVSWVSTDRRNPDIAVSGPWRVRWSGYTQRTRRTTGELESIYP